MLNNYKECTRRYTNGDKKILNKDVSNVVEESLAGYLMAYRKYYKKSVSTMHLPIKDIEKIKLPL
mgnify:CR=1 FL=1